MADNAEGPNTAYVFEKGGGIMELEHRGVKAVLEERGISVQLFTDKVLHRRQIKFSSQSLVIGDHDVMKTVFRQMGIKPPTDTYPLSVHSFLKRLVWSTTLAEVSKMFSSISVTQPLFVKPKFEAKKFAGCVVYSEADVFRLLDHVPGRLPVYCSEKVNFVSEYRVFVVDSAIVATRHYEGDESTPLDQQVVNDCVEQLENSPERTSAYAVDFGVLDDGRTALVEWNDGYALGSYGLQAETYTDLLLTRWRECVQQARTKDNS